MTRTTTAVAPTENSSLLHSPPTGLSQHFIKFLPFLKKLYQYAAALMIAILALTILITTLLGLAGVAVFFVQQFGYETLGLSESVLADVILVDIFSFVVSSTIFVGYAAGLSYAVFDNSRHIIRQLFVDTPPAQSEPVAYKHQLLRIIQWGLSVFALGVIGVSSYLGIMTVADWWDILAGSSAYASFQGFAITSSVGMFAAFSLFSVPSLMEYIDKPLIDHEKTDRLRRAANLPPQSQPRPPPIPAPSQNRSWFDRTTRLIAAKGRHVFAVGATLGFAGFKFYSCIHFLMLVGVISMPVINVVGLFAFVALCVFTYRTTGEAILDKFKTFSERPDDAGLFAEGLNKTGATIGVALSVSIAVFMAIGADMGLMEIGNIFSHFFTHLGSVTNSSIGADIFSGIATSIKIAAIPASIVGAICRFTDFMCFFAPSIIRGCGGKPGGTSQVSTREVDLDNLGRPNSSSYDNINGALPAPAQNQFMPPSRNAVTNTNYNRNSLSTVYTLSPRPGSSHNGDGLDDNEDLWGSALANK